MRAHTPLALLLVPLLACAAARADEPPAAPPAAPAPKPAPPPTPEQAADAVLAALAAKDDVALKALAARDDPDPWLVADELIRRLEHAVAEAFAQAAPREDVERLPEYVAARRGKPGDAERRERLGAASAALAAKSPAAALQALRPPDAGSVEDVLGVRLALVRGTALAWVADLRDALAAYEVAGEGAERLGWLAAAQRAFDEAGGAAYSASDFAAARRAWERALEVCERRADAAGAAVLLDRVGMAREALGDHAGALATYERVLAAREALGDRAGVAAALGNLGGFHSQRGEPAAALVFYERALAEMEALGNRAWAARARAGIGNVHRALGDRAKALTMYERALAEMEALGDVAGAAQVLGDSGSVHADQGDYPKALELYQRALETHEASGARAQAAVALGNIGAVHHALGDHATALAILERALAAKEALGDKPGAALTLGNIGHVYGALGDSSKARAFYERALAAHEALGNGAGVAATLGNLASVHYALGSSALALSIYERALAAQEALGDRARAAATLGNLGAVHHALGDHASALAILERALAAKEALGDRAGAALTLGNIGRAHHALGDHKAARAALERAVRVARSLRAVPVLVAHLRGLAEVHLASGASGRALAAAREALHAGEVLVRGLGEEDGAQARSQQAGLYEVGTLAALREEDPAEVCAFLESGRAGALLDALDKRETLRWKAETLPAELKAADVRASASERGARAAYEKALQGEDRRARAEAARTLDDALEQVREVHARIQRETKRAAALFYPQAKTIEQIQASLEPGEALVLYGLCLQEALALVVEPEAERLVALGARQDVEAACEALVLRTPEGDPANSLALLRRLLVDPLGLGESVKQVLVSPDGPLCFLPWGALFDRALAVTPSGSTHALLREGEREPGVGVLALGDPDYAGVEPGAQAIYYRGKTLAALPATRGEVEAIGTVTLLGAEASEDGFKAALPRQKRWRAVHLACHGLIDARRPGLSSLALSRAGEADGFLTALEVLRMQVPADLAVLSACETATGKLEGGEGIVGLTRAFMYAGTPRVLCSLWKVDDEATAALMKKFYELWMGAPRAAVPLSDPGAAPGESQGRNQGAVGLPAAEALRQSQQFLAAQERWSHPYYWAAWVLWGLP